MISRALILSLVLVAPAWAGINEVILEQIRAMPSGGGYATNLAAHRGLADSVRVGEAVEILPDRAAPGYCSGATYLVFLKTLAALQKSNGLAVDRETWEALAPRLRPDGTDTLPDGTSLWGRWNANGPGTARLFHELKLGRNFTRYTEAQPGDFMKIFWTDAVGKKESGHSVIFLGLTTENGEEMVHFWSSNQPGGFGEKAVPRAKISRAIFSRLERPENLNRWRSLPEKDAYLASLLRTESSFDEARKKSGTD